MKSGRHNRSEQSSRRRLCAEFIGTFALVFVGAGSVIIESHTGMSHAGLPDGKVSLVGIALAHGLILMAMICAMGSISGGHFNPAVSFAMWTRGKLRTEMMTGYILAQLSAAAVAGLFLAGLFPDEIELAGLGTPALAPKISAFKGMFIEGIITFLLVTSILFVTRDENDDKRFAGIAIGLTLTAVILFAGPLTGGAANPARYLGPALASARLSELLVYIIGPMAGAAIASVVFWFATSDEAASEPSGEAPRAAMPPAPSGAPHPSAAPQPQGAAHPSATAQPPPVIAGLSGDDLIPVARNHFDRGNWLESAQSLIPLLWEFDRHDLETRKRVRSLLMVIEAEAGELNILDSYRHLIYQSS
jgi:aquaporin Z